MHILTEKMHFCLCYIKIVSVKNKKKVKFNFPSKTDSVCKNAEILEKKKKGEEGKHLCYYDRNT